MYFAITGGEDGIMISKVEDMEHFLKDALGDEGEDNATQFLADFPNDPWSKKRAVMYRESQPDGYEAILIKGEIVVPKKKEKVIVYEIEE